MQKNYLACYNAESAVTHFYIIHSMLCERRHYYLTGANEDINSNSVRYSV